MMIGIRKAQQNDVARLVDLSEQKRTQYEHYQPTFWHKAEDSREKQRLFFEHLLSRENVILLVHEREDIIDGFIIATFVTAPPVYNPGGFVCSIDDFCVVSSSEWQGIGRSLLDEMMHEAKERGATLAVVVCGHLDKPKREMLRALGFSIATEWYVRDM